MSTNIFQDWQGIPAKFDTPTDGNTFSIAVANRVWDPVNLVWVSQTQSGGGGGGGSVTQGTVPWVTDENQLATKFDASAAPVLYLGEASPGTAASAAAWRIQKIDTTSGVSITWAGGSASFTQVWNNRAGLVYS